MGPFDLWPAGRVFGFDYFYGFLAGESSQWEPAVVENTVRLPAVHRKGYHFTEDMADKAVAWMRRHNAITPEAPFFMYWTPGASHGPHHIFKEWADKYKGKFDDGWDAMRERIFARRRQAAGQHSARGLWQRGQTGVRAELAVEVSNTISVSQVSQGLKRACKRSRKWYGSARPILLRGEKTVEQRSH